MQRAQAIQLLQEMLSERNLQAMIIPTTDPHFGEYTQDYYKIREWLSGFTGSAGILVLTLSNAALWTDSRYFVQAAAQLQGVRIHLMKMKMPYTPSIEGWLLNQLPAGGRIAIDEALFSYSEYLSLKKALEPTCTIVPIPDPFDAIWQERKPLVFNPITYLPLEYSGEETSAKFIRLKQSLGISDQRFVYVITACDEVAWLCNIRGTDIEYNPLPQSYALVTHSAIHLFADLDALLEETKTKLTEQGVEIHPYSSFASLLKQFPADTLRICSTSKISVRDYQALDIPDARFMEDPITGGAVNRLKAVKNNWEKEGFRKAFLHDGVAWCKLLKYIDEALDRGDVLNEYGIGEQLIAFRRAIPEYRGESFEPIVAFGPNAALPHYSATEEAGCEITGNGFLLMDTGAQYLFGTTDTTRTIPIGELTEEQKKYYTLVLKGMIALSLAKFPAGTRGASLDILARGPLFNEGVMYFHGTGHGIGHNLCVHEGPQSIRMEENPVPLDAGMVLSNEPAIYFEGEYGIRTENVILVEPWKITGFNTFYQFETLTLVPIVTSCVQSELLTSQEIAWLNNYNARVYEKVSPLLTGDDEKEWLKKATSPLLS